MPITMSLREAVIHKMHGKSEDGLREMIDGSIHAQEAALPGLGVVFELMWDDLAEPKKEAVVRKLHHQLEGSNKH
jgi:small acid-soluble spore protein I (minor)